METENLNIDELLVKYWGGSAATSDKLYILDWLKANEENRKHFLQTYDVWLSASILKDYDLKTEIALDKFRLRVLDASNKKARLRKKLIYVSQVAAIFIVAFGLSYFFFQNSDISSHQLVMNQVLMPKGNKGKVELPDGSLVWLNSGSKISYPETFSGDTREVTIDGQAYFEVVHNSDKPFIVKTGTLDVKVLGTKFDVQNYSDKKQIEVSLIEGSVSIEVEGDNSNRKILKPNEKFTYIKSKTSSLIEPINAPMSAIWIKDRMTFENNKLSYIIPYLEGWYGIKVKCDKDLAENTRLTFTVRQDSLEDILKSIEYISSLHYEIKDDTVFILK